MSTEPRFFLVSSRETGQPIWVAVQPDGFDIFVWVPYLGRFVRNWGVHLDFHWDNDLKWREIDADEARELISAGIIGYFKPDNPVRLYVHDKLAAETHVWALDQVFPNTDAKEQTGQWVDC